MVKYLKRSCFLCCVSSQSVNQTVDQPMKFDSLLLILRHYNKCGVLEVVQDIVNAFALMTSAHQPSHTYSWWRHDMEIHSALLALCEGNPPVTDGFPCDLWLRPRDMAIEIGVIHKGSKWGSLVTVKAWYQSGDKHHLNQRWLIDQSPDAYMRRPVSMS